MKMSSLRSSSPGLFCSPTQPEEFQGPADEVPRLVAKAKGVKEINPALVVFIDSHQDLFYEVFSRHVQLLMSRSQALEDCHVTVYDKALLILTQNGNDLEYPAAVDFFCEEFLGVNKVGNETGMQKVLEQSVSLAAMASRACRKPIASPVFAVPVKREMSLDNPPPKSASGTPETHAIVMRLWSVYEKARGEFLNVAEKEDQTTVTAAKFLRDTAENAIEYFKDKEVDPQKLSELKATYNRAKETVVDLCGGKKRKFDRHGPNSRRGTPRGPGKHSVHSHRIWSDDNSLFLRGRHQPVQVRKAHKTVYSRGHSGIPYGYGREVDSYHPY